MSTSSCIWTSQRVRVRAVEASEATVITSPVKAHLDDGTTIVYSNGVSVVGRMLEGAGTHYDLTLTQPRAVDTIALDSVVGMESFSTETNVGESILVSTLATAGAVAGAAALAVAIFGSCPTVYSDDGRVEEAELFSSSIAPLFEARDVDRLRAQPNADGMLKLEIRNEAMETHYINHLQILEVAHEATETVLPDQQGRTLVVGRISVPDSMTNSRGKDVGQVLETADDEFYGSDLSMIERAAAGEMSDWIDVRATIPQGLSEVGVVLRLRNSLLSTILLYNEILEPMGAGGIDWLGGELTEISTAVELGRWYQQKAGLHVQAFTGGGYREVVRIPDSGPISWHDVAVVVPVAPEQRSVNVRLRFLTDYWRIDRIGIATEVRNANPRRVALGSAAGPTGGIERAALERLRAPDDEYLQTNPGQRFFAYFDVGSSEQLDRSRSFLLSSQGYYVEWIRGHWIRNASTPVAFEPADTVLLEALRKWGGMREEFEERFRSDRVPVQ